MATKHKPIDYSTSIGDLMSGLAIFFILLFVCLIVSQRQNVKNAAALTEKAEHAKLYDKNIKEFLKVGKLSCPGHESIKIKRLKGSLGVYITTDGLFPQAGSEFEDAKKKAPLKCILVNFLKSVVLQSSLKDKNVLDYVMIESKGDFYINKGFTTEDLIQNKNENFRKQFELTLDRTKTIFNLLLEDNSFGNDDMAYINAHLGGSGLSWSDHYRSLKNEAFKANTPVVQVKDSSERSIQLRLIVKGSDD